MSVTWLLAWRNLWRHRRRTWLTVGAMVFCNILLVFLISLQLGSYQMMIDGTLSTFTGHIQIQHRGYLQNQRMRQSVPGVAQLAQRVRGAPGVASAAARAEAFALASSEERSFGILLTGVQPQYEPQVSTLPDMLSQGRYLREPDAQEIVVGSLLARNLKVGLGDEVTFLGSARDGSMAAAVATVVGILHSGMDDLDRTVAQIPLGWFQQVFAMDGSGHAIVLRVRNLEQVGATAAVLRAEMPADESLVVLDWKTLQPGLQQAITSDMASAWFMYAVLIMLVAFSVLNTQLMSVLERTREFGVMLALGMRPSRLARLVAMETLLLALLGLVLGIALGVLLTAYLGQVGFTYPGMDEMAARFHLPERIYPRVSWLSLTWGPLTVFVGAMLAALYPALRLLRLRPVAAMRVA